MGGFAHGARRPFCACGVTGAKLCSSDRPIVARGMAMFGPDIGPHEKLCRGSIYPTAERVAHCSDKSVAFGLR